jgi:hypothetical protein
MNEIKLVRARAAAMGSIGVLLHHDRETLMQILGWVKSHLHEEKAMEVEALHQANLAIQKAKHGKA